MWIGHDSSIGGMRPRGSFRWLPILVFIIGGLIYYSSHREVNPYTGRTQLIGMSPSEEARLGLQSYAQVLQQSDVVPSGPEVNLVRSVGARIAKATEASDYSWEFNLLRAEQANAFCMPGGKVAVFSGLLPIAKDEDGLAVVMGHEIAHAIARHSAERMAQEQLAQFGQLAMNVATGEMDQEKQRAIMGIFGAGAQFGLLLPFSRKHESEADYLGLLLMAKACFNPEAAIGFWQRMAEAKSGHGSPLEFASTHPSDETRIEQLRAWIPRAMEERSKFCR